MTAGILILWQAAMSRSYDRGKQDAYAEVRNASQVVADSWRKKVDEAEKKRIAAEAKADATAASVIRETRTFYAQNPAAGAVQCLSPDRVQQARKARAAIISGAPSGSDGSVRVAEPPAPSDG